ncbi:pumilio homolog 5-like isoform X1 [Zingiber officinale]|uniref:pumilio homolog 5-like isoform X1 n=1 Tax=Zingiber officinale TaxID=94328 RepID=UPI001C4DCBAC|nr:pumilio homolog 5-like isoform X1 [Zingiber officinale]XP_042440836.1 pumilio homolog 5-like isoform X1 [Zingiber officinale]XP_042440837.1 pumilio homolog 5-like isoform X1 [Zingiber officinale]XP_042440838.1 pumilio homolog 5-like isoform X1 [Zingiber officinale]
MATENPLRFIGNDGAGNWALGKDPSEFSSSGNLVSEDLGSLLEGQKYHGNKGINGLSRSGSAPPSIEGSCAAFDILKGQIAELDGGLENLNDEAQNCKSEEELRAHPSYLAYYCANVNLKPRLPQPLISRENRHMMQQIGGIGQSRRLPSFDDNSKTSFFVSRPTLCTHDEEPEDDRAPRIEPRNWVDKKADIRPFILSDSEGQHNNPVDLVKEDFPHISYPDHSHPSRQLLLEQESNHDSFLNDVHDSSVSMTMLEPRKNSVGLHSSSLHTSSHSVGSILRGDLGGMPILSATLTERTVNQMETSKAVSNFENSVSPSPVIGLGLGNIKDEMRKLRLSSDGHSTSQSRRHPQPGNLHSQGSFARAQVGQSQMISQGIQHSQSPHGHPKLSVAEVQPLSPSSSISPLYITAAAYGTPYYHSLQSSSLLPSQFSTSECTLNPSLVPPFDPSLVPPFVTAYSYHQNAIPVPFENAVGSNFSTRVPVVSSGGNGFFGVDIQQLYKMYGQLGLAMHSPLTDPSYMPFYQHHSINAYSTATADQYESMISRGNAVGSLPGLYDPQQAQGSSSYLADQLPQVTRVSGVNTLNVTRGGSVSPTYYRSPTNIGVMMQFSNSPMGSPVFQRPPVAGTSFSGRENENVKFTFNSERHPGSLSGRQSQRGREKFDDSKTYSLLEELKSNKAHRYELSDIVGRVVEFSADQHGSRFIQQKLETCSVDEKASVFSEVLPHSSSLMTDVFGNYVIQKFFERGSPEQRKELANKLVGNVLALSLQMYGCRVIQKALEVIHLDQKTQLVQELDGNVMRCVRDQNGNHVIQKCIECIPAEKIGFIISAFHGQVATLSTHPYGCRVIQRVLEHCSDESQSQFIVDEILQSACLLVQDQYGNYVTQLCHFQHVLERGKAHERSEIISKLFGQIVQMSQNKFASNVIEKCLAYGSTEERDLLIKEMVGQTEGNDNLLVMMKDQFANYVVQKILETCTDKQREILLDRIKVHLPALKKYTFGKHIVTRIEQTYGEDALES